VQFGGGQRWDYFVAESALALDADQSDAMATTQLSLRHGPAGERRI